MDPPNNSPRHWPPRFVPPPPPAPHNYVEYDIPTDREFIIKCINKQKEAAHKKNTDDHETISSRSDLNNTSQELQYPRKKRARLSDTRRNKGEILIINGILRNNNIRHHTNDNIPTALSYDGSEEEWDNATLRNNKLNREAQERWRRILTLPDDLSRTNRSRLCPTLNTSWTARYTHIGSIFLCSENDTHPRRVRISLPQLQLSPREAISTDQCLLQTTRNMDKANQATQSRKRRCTGNTTSTQKEISATHPLNNIKANLQSRAERKVTRIATWNINNGFDHLAIASIMAKKDIDILALQEPRISYSPTDDIWISTMRKELRKCKYEMITSQYSYIIFDEQTSGAALASIIRQNCKVNGRLLSVTFKSNDIWEVHTIISLYAVTNAKSNKRYACSHSSRKTVNKKLTKALTDEILYLQETYGDAPITVIGDYQDTIHTDSRDNIGIVGKKMHPTSPLPTLLSMGFQSAYHLIYPNKQQVTRWNSSKSAGRHIDLQMLNETAATLLINVQIDDNETRNHITSDHLIVVADFNIEKREQDIVDSYRTKINFRKIAGIKMKCNKKQYKCSISSLDKTSYTISFDDNQFMSSMVQDQSKMLVNWQNEASSNTYNDILTMLENSMQALEDDIALEDCTINEFFDAERATVQRKLVERNPERRAQLDSIYNSFQKTLYQVATSLKIVSTENRHIEALCARHALKTGKTKKYGQNIINLTAPTSKIRSALGDLKHAEATLRNLQHNLARTSHTAPKHCTDLQRSFQSLSKNKSAVQYLVDASAQLYTCHKEAIANEVAVSSHRKLDAFSGRWTECSFSSEICRDLISKANNILQYNNVKQRVGIRQLDQSSNDEDKWSDLADWWNGPDLTVLANSSNVDINNPVIADAIQNALLKTRKLKKKAMATLINNKETLLTHNSRMNHTRFISQRLNPQTMEEPEAHHVILDPNNIHAKSSIRCNDFHQCLDNTRIYHQNWMDRSGSKWEHLWFKTTSKFGHINGITFSFTGKPTDAEFEYLVKGHQECSENVRKAFCDAHSDAIADIMRPPNAPYRALDWLWHPNTNDEDWNPFVENYWKAITNIPGKARYNGYTMAIVGRLPRRWIDLHLRMMKMMMMLRILPDKTKIQARIPIPKPKPGETRPLSLLHDDMCFILGFLTKHYTLKCEEIHLFPPTLHAYRQGMSTSFITLVDLATREDALSFGRYMALTAEDEEKFFDRVSLEVQLAVLFILGFPMEGLLEMKAEEMDNISVEIHTRHGHVIGKFLHGLKQGSPLSVLLSNATLVFKHRVWNLRDPLATTEDPNGYAMSAWNNIIDGDTPPILSMEGFCDDNSKWNMGNGRDFASMVKAVQWNIKMAGDLSMIFKIGRRGDKTIIELFNVDLEDIPLLPSDGFTSIAWDFKANRPTEEEVDCRVYLKNGQILPSIKPDSISDAIWSMLIKGTSLKPERSLGIWRNKLADTSESADKRAILFGAKIDRLNLSSLKNDKTIKIAVNSLVVPVYQFGILENECCPATYDKMDVILINKVHKALGFAWCDAKQLMFVSEEKFGMGIRSVSVEMLKSICRELEIQLNDEALLGKILRGRLEAFKDASFHHAGKSSFASYDTINHGVRNFIMAAIRHIAHYGFFIRDMNDVKITYQIESAITLAQDGSLFRKFQHHTLGMHDYAGMGSRSGTTLGHGDNNLLWSIIYGRCHTLLHGCAVPSNTKLNFSAAQILAIRTKATEIFQDDLCALYTVFEWSNATMGFPQDNNLSGNTHLPQIFSSMNNTSHWRRLSALSCLKQSHNEDIISDEDNFCFLDGLLNSNRGDLLQQIDSCYIKPNRIEPLEIESLLIQGWPLIVATDGGAGNFKTGNDLISHSNASASVVICQPPNVPFEQYIAATKEEQEIILTQNLLPWKARATSLPPKIGDHITDNGHAECFALILLEEWIPPDTPILLIMDSEAERSRYHQLQNLQNTTNRFLIRSLMAGVSKCLGNRLASAVNKHPARDDNLQSLFSSNIIELCLHAKSWCYNTSGEQSHWTVDQWAPGQLRSVWAIRSHQLEDDFSISPKNRYGQQLVPNRMFVSANQWADNACNAILRFKRNAIISCDGPEYRKWCSPTIALGLTGQNFIITSNGYCLDRCVSTAVEEACIKEFIRRIAHRPTQGLLLRLQSALFIKPEMIGRQSYHRRLLEGKTKTHTRAIYTDSDYRKGIVYAYAKNEDWEDNTDKVQQALKDSTKSYKYLRCPFCISKFHDRDRHIFQEHASENSGLLGNSRHFRFYCLNDCIQSVRQQMNQLLEDHLTNLLRLASNWGRSGFATLIDRVTNALIALDRSGFHNVHMRNTHYVKPTNLTYACFSSDDWILFFEAQSKHVEAYGKEIFSQWPLLHLFGFIAANCYSSLEMQDGQYSPCDLIPLGIIPLVLQEVISQFAHELGTRHSLDTKKEFLIQWQQVRAAALLRAISIAMATGAQISEHKSNLLEEVPTSLLQDTSQNPRSKPEQPVQKSLASCSPSPAKNMPRKPTISNASDRFPCNGITCSSLFTRLTNLRSSSMRKSGDTCRRCLNMSKGIACAEAIEQALGNQLESFRSFYNLIMQSNIITVDVIIDAISQMDPIPNGILPPFFKRTTKRNVYSIVTTNTARLLSGTFNWKMPGKPTSIDIVFNQASSRAAAPRNKNLCSCQKEQFFFAVDPQVLCSICNGRSKFCSTSTRVRKAQAPLEPIFPPANQAQTEYNTQNPIKKANKRYKGRGRVPNAHSNNNVILRDITNLSARTPLYLASRPTVTEINGITQVNNMLSNFVVTYFFKLLAHTFSKILYEEFLFDLVTGEGGWKQFVESRKQSNHYTNFFLQLSNPAHICIIPICCHTHWSLLVRRFIGSSWKIFFVDSISQGSDKRFRDWKALFQDDNLFLGEWIKIKILQQSELECGARVCLHGVCFSLSKKKYGDIINDLSRFKDLATRSRLMVSHICKDGYWSYPKWLSRTIGDEEELAI